MARGRKSALSFEEQLNEIESEMQKHQEALKRLKEKKKKVLEAKKEADMAKISQALEQSGLSADELLGLIETKKA